MQKYYSLFLISQLQKSDFGKSTKLMFCDYDEEKLKVQN